MHIKGAGRLAVSFYKGYLVNNLQTIKGGIPFDVHSVLGAEEVCKRAKQGLCGEGSLLS